jgi:branched-chain amino acid aminotransferase
MVTILEYEPVHQPYFELLNRSWFTPHFGMAPEPIDEFVLTQPEIAILSHGGAILMASYDDEIAGTVALKKTDSHTFEFTKMAVREEFRGKGIGAALSKAAIGKARSLGAKRIILYSHSSLKAAVHLYRKLGFREITLEPGTYARSRCDMKMELWLETDPINHAYNTTNMELMTQIPIAVRKTAQSRIHEVDWDHLEMGQHTADHMLVCDYTAGEWQVPQILPFANFSLAPTTLALHYGQTIFEGMKAFRMEDGRVHIFRPQKHYKRFVRSAERMAMPVVSQEVFTEGLRKLVELDKDWVSGKPGCALYLRPLMIATDTIMRVHISETYRYAVVTSPAGPYFLRAIRVKVERDYVRAGKGGTGYTKCGGNYGGAFYPTQKAKEQGYDQVLWTDGRENKYIEESGMMNAMFVLGDTLVTPPLSDSILDGVTRDSLPVEQRPVSVDELKKAFEQGTIREAFGAGTAAVISPISVIGIDGVDYELPSSGPSEISLRLKAALDDIRYGRKADIHGWNCII